MQSPTLIFSNLNTFLPQTSLETLIAQLKTRESPQISLIIAPSLIHISFLKQTYPDCPISSQCCSMYSQGPYTGEVAADQLADIGVSWIIVGHHNRRRFEIENDEKIIQILNRAQENNLKVLLAVGETLIERKVGFSADVLQKQLEVLKDWRQDWENISVVYQPVWNFEVSGKVSDLELEKVKEVIFRLLCKIIDEENARKVKVLLDLNEFDEEVVGKRIFDGFLISENGSGNTINFVDAVIGLSNKIEN